MTDETEIMDWGSDMKACLAHIAANPLPPLPVKRATFDDEDRTMDRMFDRTRYEQASYDAYQRLLDQGHRA